uniref:DUF38 domain-containing protein n=2 Tax=Panagrolaimus sp. JU765 TaxID=591449 RepID=A0AC34QKV8_9BILA
MLSGKSFNCEFYVTFSTKKFQKMTRKTGKNKKKIRGLPKPSITGDLYGDMLGTSFWETPNNQTLDFLANFMLIGQEASNAVQNLFANVQEIVLMPESVMFKDPNHERSLYFDFDKNHEVLLQKLLKISTEVCSKITVYDVWTNQYITTVFKTLADEPKQQKLMIEILNFMTSDIVAAFKKLNAMNIPVTLTGIQKNFLMELPICQLDCLSLSCVGDIDLQLLYNIKASKCTFRKLELLDFDMLDQETLYSKYRFDFVEEIEFSLHPWFVPQLKNGFTFFRMMFPNVKKVTMKSAELLHPNVEIFAIINAVHEAWQPHVVASIGTFYNPYECQWMTYPYYGQQIQFVQGCEFIWVDPVNDAKIVNLHVAEWNLQLELPIQNNENDRAEYQYVESVETLDNSDYL